MLLIFTDSIGRGKCEFVRVRFNKHQQQNDEKKNRRKIPIVSFVFVLPSIRDC